MNELLRTLLHLPPQASTMAGEIDALHYFVISVTMAGAAGVSALAAYFIYTYRRHPAVPEERTPDSRKGHSPGGAPIWIEALIVVGLLSLFVLWWVIGFRQYVALRVPPKDCIEIYVTAKKWMWQFSYADGTRSHSVLYVPAHRRVKLLMSSRDVIHSFYVPAFRIKQDVIPGRTTEVWFEANEPGIYTIFCSEYCGTGHSTMRGEVHALSPGDYERRESQATSLRIPGPEYREPGIVGQYPREAITMAAMGERVAVRRGCLQCHTTDGTPHIGPSFARMYGTTIILDDGREVVANPEYLTESMMDPLAKIHAGFAPLMPSFHGLIGPADIGALLEFIKSLRTGATDPNDPLARRPKETP